MSDIYRGIPDKDGPVAGPPGMKVGVDTQFFEIGHVEISSKFIPSDGLTYGADEPTFGLPVKWRPFAVDLGEGGFTFQDGIYINLPAAHYHRAESLSNSIMKELRVSPLNFWWLSPRNPAYEKTDETKAQRRGSMRHKYSLEKAGFFDEYCLMPVADDYPNALDGVKEIQEYMRNNFIKPISGTKPELIRRIRMAQHGPDVVQFLDEILEAADKNLGDKKTVTQAELNYLEFADKMLEPLREYINGGLAEVSIFWTDEETGVRMKCRIDYLKPRRITDLKTFTNFQKFPLNAAVAREIDGRRMGTQSLMNLTGWEKADDYIQDGQIFGLPEEADEAALTIDLLNEIFAAGYPDFTFLFQMADPPFEVRARHFKQREGLGGTENVYWVNSRNIINRSIATFQRYDKEYGRKPWVMLDAIERDLTDDDLPWSRFEDRDD